MIVRVFSKKDFVNTMVAEGVTDTSVNNYNQFFICIDSTGGPDSQPYFKQPHTNVIRLVFDDVEEDSRNWGADVQAYYDAVAMREHQAQELFDFIQTVPKNSTINIHCAKGQSRSVAVQSFILNQEDGNPHVLKLLRKVSGLFN